MTPFRRTFNKITEIIILQNETENGHIETLDCGDHQGIRLAKLHILRNMVFKVKAPIVLFPTSKVVLNLQNFHLRLNPQVCFGCQGNFTIPLPLLMNGIDISGAKCHIVSN